MAGLDNDFAGAALSPRAPPSVCCPGAGPRRTRTCGTWRRAWPGPVRYWTVSSRCSRTRRADVRRGDGKLLAEQRCRSASTRQRLGTRSRARDRHGRAALPPGDAESRRSPAASGAAWRSARLLLEQPDLLLLDEPTNHLDAESVAWLERHLHEYPRNGRRRHARSLLPRQRRRLDPRARPRPRHSVRGQLHVLARAEAARLAQEEKRSPARQRTLERELEWVRMAPRARQEAKARLNAYESSLAETETQARCRTRSTSRRDRRSGTWSSRPRTSAKAFGESLLIEDLTFSLPRGGIVGVIGPNGAGKTTLIRMITGQETPDGGRASHRRHGRARLRRPVPRSPRPRQDGLGGDLGRRRADLGREARGQLRAYVAAFNFKGRDQQKKVGELSGGERNRLHLAKLLQERRQRAAPRRADQRPRRRHAASARGSTSTFAGCAVVISHDRWFLDRIATHVLAFEGDRGSSGSRATPRPTSRRQQATRGRGRPAAPDHL